MNLLKTKDVLTNGVSSSVNKNRVMLLTPPGKVYVRRDGTPAARKHCSPPIGIAYLASNLLKHNYEVQVIDALVDGYDQEIYEEPFIIYGLNPKQVVERVKNCAKFTDCLAYLIRFHSALKFEKCTIFLYSTPRKSKGN